MNWLRTFSVALFVTLAIGGAHSTSVTTTGAGVGKKPASIEFVASATGSNSSGTVTWSNISIGTAFTGRVVFFAWGSASNAAGTYTFSSVTFNGNAATQVYLRTALQSVFNCGIYAAVIDTGTTMNVVVTSTQVTGTPNNNLGETYVGTNIASLTPFDIDSGTNNTIGLAITNTIDVPAGGASLSHGCFYANTVPTDLQWSGGTTNDSMTVGGRIRTANGSTNFAGAQSALGFTATPTGGVGAPNNMAATASFSAP